MDNWLKSTATILYDPPRPGIKKIRKEKLVIARVDQNITKYYRWWVAKRFGLMLSPPVWDSHITIFDGRKSISDKFEGNWNKHQRSVFTFDYNVEIEQHWKFWTLQVKSPKLELIRLELGINPSYKFHLTIGRME